LDNKIRLKIDQISQKTATMQKQLDTIQIQDGFITIVPHIE